MKKAVVNTISGGLRFPVLEISLLYHRRKFPRLITVILVYIHTYMITCDSTMDSSGPHRRGSFVLVF